MLASTLLVIALARRADAPPSFARLQLVPPKGVTVENAQISPDGRRIVFVGREVVEVSDAELQQSLEINRRSSNSVSTSEIRRLTLTKKRAELQVDKSKLDLKVAKMYLVTVYAQQYVPGVDTPENLRNAQLAIEQYKQVLEKDPSNVTSLKGIGFLYMQQKKFDDSREYYKKANALVDRLSERFTVDAVALKNAVLETLQKNVRSRERQAELSQGWLDLADQAMRE